MKLFQSIFGGSEGRGRYPASLVHMAIERAVEGTDPRLRLVPGYQKLLRQSIVHAIDHVVALVDSISTPVSAGPRDHGAEPCLPALFASAAAMLEVFGRDTALRAFLASPEGTGAERVTALLLAEPMERRILGMDLVGDQVRRDVPQVTVSFVAHRLLDPRDSEAETRRQLKRRAFDHLLTLALGRITAIRVEKDDLLRQRDLLRRKLSVLERGGWSFESAGDAPPDPVDLAAELDGISAQLDALKSDGGVLQAHLDIVTESLGQAERQLWAEDTVLFLDAMNIQRAEADPSARRILLQELRNAQGRRAVMLPISLMPRDLPPREDFVAAAQRYL